MDALNRFMGQKPSGPLYHYTGAAGIIGIVKSKRLWATDYRHLNDHKEYQIGAKLLKDELRASHFTETERKQFDMQLRKALRGYFVLSFSERKDQLSQWRAYCPGGNGYALGFQQRNPLFTSAKQHSYNLIRCEYNPRKQQELCRYLIQSFNDEILARQRTFGLASPVDESIRLRFEQHNWCLALALAMSSIKHRGFREEKEWRLVSQYPEDSLYGVSFRNGRFGVTPYFELPLAFGDERPKFDNITIGPTANGAASREALELLLSVNELEVGTVCISGTPLRQ